ncbi:MAG: hypothetical protein AAF628_20465 [Planctomycetota bacterium]
MTTSIRVAGMVASWAVALAPDGPCQCPISIDLTAGPGSSSHASHEVGFGQDLYFSHSTASMGRELWKWSPATGVVMVADVKPGSGTSNPAGMTACCTALGPRLFFSAAGTGINHELWITDVVAGTTAQVAEIRSGGTGSVPGNFTAVGNRVMFTANDGVTGVELWVSDGTGPGTNLVKDIRVGRFNSSPQDLVALGNKVLFTADDFSGRELWVSDGTASGTINLSDLVPRLGTLPIRLTPCGDVAFFAGIDATVGETLWKTDGTPGGTVAVNPALPLPSLSELTCCGDRVFFTSGPPGVSSLLHVSDGTAAGTHPVQSGPSTAATSPGNLTSSNGRVFFSGRQSATGGELWVSDGTDAGTVLVADIHPGVQSSQPHDLAAVGTGVCFSADDGTNGQEPWFSDGTPGGTFMLCDLNPTGPSNPRDLHVVAGQLYLTAAEPSIGVEPHILATPGAHVERLGAGGAPDFPTLVTRNGAPPVLGTTIDIVSGDRPAGHVGFLLFGVAGLPAAPWPPFMQGGCDWVGLLAGTGTSVASTASSSFSLPLTIPDWPTLEGAALHVQMVWLDPSATLAIQMSSGLQLVLGEALPH